MTAPKKFPWTFRNVCVRKPGTAVLVASFDKSMETDAPISSLIGWDGSGWATQDSHAANGTGFILVESPRMLMMLGKEGVVYHWLDKGGFREEPLDASGSGPQNYGDMQEIRIIGNRPYAVGMARCTYRRLDNGAWEAIDSDIRSEEEEEDVGFFSIDGYGEKEIYAVGLEGEIGLYNGKSWRFADSPTNLILYRVVCAPNDKVYVCGQGGVILEGRKNQWKLIEQDVTEETFWGSTWFNDRLYLSTSEGIYRLEDGELIPVEILPATKKKIKTTKGLSFYRLDARNGYLWSVGSKMAMWTEDGEHWQEVTY